jgi:uncharacterized protein
MILVDVNLLVYAVNRAAPFHAKAKAWWEEELCSRAPVAVSWFSLYGFLRIITNPRAIERPLALPDALGVIQNWLELPQLVILQPTSAHFGYFRQMLSGLTANPKLISDAHFAALALEHNCELNSADRDFARFPGLRWRNPLVQPPNPPAR